MPPKKLIGDSSRHNKHMNIKCIFRSEPVDDVHKYIFSSSNDSDSNNESKSRNNHLGIESLQTRSDLSSHSTLDSHFESDDNLSTSTESLSLHSQSSSEVTKLLNGRLTPLDNDSHFQLHKQKKHLNVVQRAFDLKKKLETITDVERFWAQKRATNEKYLIKRQWPVLFTTNELINHENQGYGQSTTFNHICSDHITCSCTKKINTSDQSLYSSKEKGEIFQIKSTKICDSHSSEETYECNSHKGTQIKKMCSENQQDANKETPNLEINKSATDKIEIPIFKNNSTPENKDHLPLNTTLVYFYFDLDSFYASVSMRNRPTSGPLAIGSLTMLAACNYRARSFGIRAGMPGYHALTLCPQLEIRPLDFSSYNQYSSRIMDVLNRFDRHLTVYGLDECVLRIDPIKMVAGFKILANIEDGKFCGICAIKKLNLKEKQKDIKTQAIKEVQENHIKAQEKDLKARDRRNKETQKRDLKALVRRNKEAQENHIKTEEKNINVQETDKYKKKVTIRIIKHHRNHKTNRIKNNLNLSNTKNCIDKSAIGKASQQSNDTKKTISLHSQKSDKKNSFNKKKSGPRIDMKMNKNKVFSTIDFENELEHPPDLTNILENNTDLGNLNDDIINNLPSSSLNSDNKLNFLAVKKIDHKNKIGSNIHNKNQTQKGLKNQNINNENANTQRMNDKNVYSQRINDKNVHTQRINDKNVHIWKTTNPDTPNSANPTSEMTNSPKPTSKTNNKNKRNPHKPSTSDKINHSIKCLIECDNLLFTPQNLQVLCQHIRDLVFNLTGLSISGGISLSIGTAKLVTSVNKPNGQFALLRNVQKYLKELKIDKLNGIGPQTTTLLNRLDIFTIKDLLDHYSTLLLLLTPKTCHNILRLAHGLSCFDTTTQINGNNLLTHTDNSEEKGHLNKSVDNCHIIPHVDQAHSDKHTKTHSFNMNRSFLPTDEHKEILFILWHICDKLYRSTAKNQTKHDNIYTDRYRNNNTDKYDGVPLSIALVTLSVKTDQFTLLTRQRKCSVHSVTALYDLAVVLLREVLGTVCDKTIKIFTGDHSIRKGSETLTGHILRRSDKGKWCKNYCQNVTHSILVRMLGVSISRVSFCPVRGLTARKLFINKSDQPANTIYQCFVCQKLFKNVKYLFFKGHVNNCVDKECVDNKRGLLKYFRTKPQQ